MDKFRQLITEKEPKPRDRNIVKKFAYATRVGYYPGKPDKPNQDAYILSPNIGKKSAEHLFGVADGHGLYGHEVSHFVKVMLPIIFAQRVTEMEDEHANQDFIKDAYETVHRDIAVSNVTSADFSGTTLCTLFLKGRNLYAANTGDSRAILITASKEVFQLTKD